MESYPKVIRIDSRYRKPDSGSSSDFRYELPVTVNFPEGTRCYVSAVSLPNSWFNVDAGLSDKLYVVETRTVAGAQIRRCRVVQLDAGNYSSLSLPTALAEKLNAGRSFTAVQYQVDYVGARGVLKLQLVSMSGASDATARFQLPSEDELLSASWKAANWTGTADAYDAADVDTMGDLLRLPATSAPVSAQETGLLNVAPTDVLYLHSNLAGFDGYGPRGEQDIIQRIAVTVSYGYTLHYVASGSDSEHFAVSGSVRELSISLTNVRGRVIDLHGGQMSLELTFDAPRL